MWTSYFFTSIFSLSYVGDKVKPWRLDSSAIVFSVGSYQRHCVKYYMLWECIKLGRGCDDAALVVYINPHGGWCSIFVVLDRP